METRLILFAALATSLCCDGRAERQEVATSGTLILLRERTLADLLSTDEHHEASGVTLADGALRVVFDDSTRVAEVDLSLTSAKLGPGARSRSQYEGITIATRPAPKTYVVREVGGDGYGVVVTIDTQGNVAATEPTDISFQGDKGLEGIAWLDDIERLLVLCEEGSCGAGGKGSRGMIKSLRHDRGSWVTEATLSLPARAAFDDFSDLAVSPEADGRWRVAVLSQASSALWLGTMTTRPLAFGDPGAVYGFPRDKDDVQYCSLEGVTFLDPSTFAMVSDRLSDAKGCTKAESMHVFRLP